MSIRKNIVHASFVVVATLAFAACSSSSSKQNENADKKPDAAPALADDAIVGSCQASDDSFCDEYRNRAHLKANERDLEVSMTKGACTDMKGGVWRDGKGCDAKGEVGACESGAPNALKRVGHTLKGDEEMAATACTDLLSGKWTSSLADDVPLGSCDYGDACVELRNNLTADASTRIQKIASETEYCEGHEGTFSKGKACNAEKAAAKCTSKGLGSLTQIRYTLTSDTTALTDAKELCDIGGDSKFEKLSPPKKTAMR